MDKNIKKEFDFSNFTFNELLLLSIEINQFIKNVDSKIKELKFSESREIANLYFNESTRKIAEEIISDINKLIVTRNENIHYDVSRKNDLENLMNEENSDYYFIIKMTENQLYYFIFVGEDKKQLLVSETYSRLESCKQGIKSLQHQIDENYLYKGKIQICKDSGEKFKFVIKANNGLVLAVSSAYTSKESCEEDIEIVKKFAKNAYIYIS